MDLHHTFSRVYAWLSGMLAQPLTPRIRSWLGVVVVLLGVLTVVHVNFVAQPGYTNELLGSNINESLFVQIKRFHLLGNQVCEDRGLFYKDEGRQDDEMMQNPLDKKGEGRQDDEMMQNQATRPNPNPAEKAGFVYKVKEKWPGCQTQSQTGQNQTLTQTQTQTVTQTQTTEYKTGDKGRQDDEVIGCQIPSQTGQTQTGKAQLQTQTQTQLQTQTETQTAQSNQTGI